MFKSTFIDWGEPPYTEYLPEGYWEMMSDRLAEILIPVVSKAGAKAAVESALLLSTIGLSIDWNLVNDVAVRTASIYTYDFITRMTESMQAHLAMAISDSIAEGETLSALIDRVGGIFGRDRAEAIGITETTRLFSQANVEYWQKAGMQSKIWMTANDEIVCDICGPQDQKIIPIYADGFAGVFSGKETSVPYPPAHVRCRCYLLPSTELVAAPSPSEKGTSAEEYLRRVEEDEWVDFMGISEEDVLFKDYAKSLYHSSMNDWGDGLTDEQRGVLKAYTGSAHREFNSTLRSGALSNYWQKDMVFSLDDTLAAGMPVGENIVVYRGIGGSFGRDLASAVSNLTPGAELLDNGFMSSSISARVGDDFGRGIRYKIFVEKGALGRYVSPLSQYQSEYEFLIPRGVPLTVLKVEDTPEGPLVWLYLPKTAVSIKLDGEPQEVKDIMLKARESEKTEADLSHMYEKLDSAEGFFIRIDGQLIQMADYLKIGKEVQKVVTNAKAIANNS